MSTNPEFIRLAQAENPLLPAEDIGRFIVALDNLEPYATYSTYAGSLHGSIKPDTPGLGDTISYSVYTAEAESHDIPPYDQQRVHVSFSPEEADHGYDEDIVGVILTASGNMTLHSADNASPAEVLATTTNYMETLLPIVEQDAIEAARKLQKDEAIRQHERQRIAECFDEITDSVLQAPLATMDELHATSSATALTSALLKNGIDIAGSQRIGRKTTAHFTQPLVAYKRPYIFGFVEQDGQPTEPQLFYLSMTHSVWRWAAAYDYKENWIEKGTDEQAMTLPGALQASLHAIMTPHNAERRPKRIPHDQLLELQRTFMPTTSKDSSIPRPLNTRHFEKCQLHLDEPGDQPDLSQPSVSYQFESPMYGQVYTNGFTSRNGRIRYTFAHTPDGLAWLMYCEDATSNVIRGEGLVSNRYVDLSDAKLDLSPFEYASQVPITVVPQPTGRNTPHHVSIFEGHHLNQPLIAAYYDTIPRGQATWADFLPADVRISAELRRQLGRLQNVAADQTPEILAHTVEVVTARYDNPEQYEATLHHMDGIASAVARAHEEAAYGPGTLIQPYAVKADSTDMEALESYLDLAGFTLQASRPETHDDTVCHEYYQSPLYPDTELIISRHRHSDILDIVGKILS